MRRQLSGRSLILILFLVFMAYNSVTSGQYANIGAWLTNKLLLLPGIVIGITIHEFAHAFAAYKLGDQTPKAQGRVTLNPLAHIDLIGIAMLILVGFGWGRPVQVNPFAFRKNRRLCNLLTDVAGVVTNFVVAFFCTVALIQAYVHGADNTLLAILQNIVVMNLVLMLFNLLPVPPLDGFGIVTEIFDLRRQPWYQPLYSNGSIILLLLLVIRLPGTGNTIIGSLLGPALGTIFEFFWKTWLAILY